MAEKDKDQREGGPEEQAQGGGQGPKTLWVKSTLPKQEDGGNKVVLWEKDPAHPKGEVLIAGDNPVEVGLTPAVSQALRDGKVVEAGGPRSAQPPARGAESQPRGGERELNRPARQ